MPELAAAAGVAVAAFLQNQQDYKGKKVALTFLGNYLVFFIAFFSMNMTQISYKGIMYSIQ